MTKDLSSIDGAQEAITDALCKAGVLIAEAYECGTAAKQLKALREALVKEVCAVYGVKPPPAASPPRLERSV